jgi:branched-chain amino acid aminotransferase
MSKWIFYNDEFLPAEKPVLQAGNRLLQYGDGLFETMRVCNGKIVLEQFHFDRLLSGMMVLMMDDFSSDYLRDAVLRLCIKNDLQLAARVRLTVFRDRGIIIESWPLDSAYIFKTDPFVTDIFPGVYKSIDKLSAYKTAAYLPYALAAVFSRKHGLNDCLMQNTSGRFCDSSIANVFYVKNKVVHTPSLAEGCINGVMRRHIINSFPIKEGPVGLSDLATANEIFLTNVIRGIQPVTRFAGRELQISLSREIFNTVVKPLTEQ